MGITGIWMYILWNCINPLDNMKYMKYLAAVALLIATSAVSYQCGKNSCVDVASKDYQAACVLSDVCHFMMDNLGNDAEEIYYDTIDNLDCDPDLVITREEIQKYNWIY